MAVWQPACIIPQNSTVGSPEPAPSTSPTEVTNGLADVSFAARVHTGFHRTGGNTLLCAHSATWSWSRATSYHPVSKGTCYSQASLCPEPPPSLPLPARTWPPLRKPPSPKCKQLPGRSPVGRPPAHRVTQHSYYHISVVTGAPHKTTNDVIPIFKK